MRSRLFLLFLIVFSLTSLAAQTCQSDDTISQTVLGYGWGFGMTEAQAIAQAEQWAQDDVDQQIVSMDSMYDMMGYENDGVTVIDSTSNTMPYPMMMYFYCQSSLEVAVVYKKRPAVALTVTVTSAPASPVIIGNTVSLSYTVAGGVGGYMVTWESRCGGDPTPWGAAGNASPLVWCAHEEGSHQYKAKVTDMMGNKGEATITIAVQGPDDLQATSSINGNSNGGGPGTPLVVTHKFKALKGMTAVGPCWSTTAYEWIAAKKADGTWEDGPPAAPKTPDDWAGLGGVAGSDPMMSAGFYFHSPDIIDTKTYIAPGNWGGIAADAVLGEYKQWVAVKVPICGDPANTARFLIAGPFHFKIIKVAPDKVKHALQP